MKFGEACSQMYVYDFDGDGDNDVLSTSAHQTGMWWHEQKPDGWETHLISDAFSQTHSLNLVDINGDKLPDFVTGKRWWAHGPKGDANPDKPAVVFWFELRPQGRQAGVDAAPDRRQQRRGHAVRSGRRQWRRPAGRRHRQQEGRHLFIQERK